MAAEDHRNNLKNPPATIEEYLALLERQGLSETVAALALLYSEEQS